MSYRPWSFVRAVMGVGVGVVLAAACGRSDLEDGELGGGSSSSSSSTMDGGNLPDVQQSDQFVQDSRPPPQICDGVNCPGGCCSSAGFCQPGTSFTACGVGGQLCSDCSQRSGTVCDPTQRACTMTKAPCSPSTCDGCCINDQCTAGTGANACGSHGESCQNCSATGLACGVVANQFECIPPPPPSCGPSNCQGCCDSGGQCEPGFLDTACGQNGSSCTDCSAIASTCDGSSSPRVCTNQQAMCPAPYNGCSGALQTAQQPTHQNVCTQTELDNLGNACLAGAHTAPCNSFFQFERSMSPKCATCLSSFAFDYTELKGIFACLAPFVGDACDHQTACITDCVDATCSQCPDVGTRLQCEAEQAQTGACNSFVQNAQCIALGLALTAPFCAPQTIYGQWIQGVATQFCGP